MLKRQKGPKGRERRKIEAQVMEVEAEKEVIKINDELEEEEETEDFGPEYNPLGFQFLLEDKQERMYELQCQLNRPFKAALNYLDNPHGSVKLYQGDTAVICAVYGPTEVRMAKELPHRAAVDVLFRPKVTGTFLTQSTGWDTTLEERSIEAKITGILESVIFLEDDMGSGFNVILHELENDGCLFATCVNATALALLNAGCSMRCTFSAVTVLLKDNKMIIDPSTSQINQGSESGALITYVFSNDGHLLYSDLQGKTSAKMITLGMRQASVACREVFRFQKKLQQEECSLHFQSNMKMEEEDVKVEMKSEMEVEVEVEEGEVD